MASNEKEIRESLKSWLDNQYNGIILDEFTGGSMKTRPDVTCFTGDGIIMCEIKSDKDSLSRLRTQVEDYLKHSSRVYVVLDVVHVNAFDKHMKDEHFKNLMESYYVEICWFQNNSLHRRINENFVEFVTRRYHKDYRSIPVEILYSFLWGEEVKSLVDFLKGRSKLSVSNTFKYIDVIERIYSIHELRTLIFEIINDRMMHLSYNRKWDRSFTGGRYKSEVKNQAEKQKIFDDYISYRSKKN